MNHFLAGKMETVIDFECVPTYSQKMVAQIVDMDENVIVHSTSLRAGTIAF